MSGEIQRRTEDVPLPESVPALFTDRQLRVVKLCHARAMLAGTMFIRQILRIDIAIN